MNVLRFYSNPAGHIWKPAMICTMLILAFTTTAYAQNDPVADFTADQTTGCQGLVVIFTDQSIDANAWNWSFPNGTPSSASTQGPHQVTYSNPGIFDVTLEVSNQIGSNKKTKPDYIVINDCSPVADFSVSPSSGCCPLTVTYTDQSVDATEWNWSFPGGSPSGAQTRGPHIVTYTSPGSYEATLVVANQYGQDTEVKNDVVTVSMCYDFGDAPFPYPTTLEQNGARHTIMGGVFLGQGIDDETDGRPDSTATGDDNDGFDDEDGMEWLNELVPGDTARVIITASGEGYLKAWIDFNRDGDWEDEGEEVVDEQVGEGANELEIFVPEDAVEGPTYARIRYSGNVIPSYDGEVSTGEVEDMRVFIQPRRLFDYGDAPDDDTFHYNTLFANNGARHPSDASLFLGNSADGPPDMELDGKQSADALGDNNDGDNDENGVIIANHSSPGEVTLIEVWLTGEGYLHGWVDFNCDGDFTDIDEYCIQYDNTSPSMAPLHHLSWVTPETAVPGTTYARFRYCTDPVPFRSDGRGGFGEVEDYQIELLPLKNDYGDAPDYYNTAGFEPACHPVSPTARLGTCCDPDSSDQPSVKADGDDTDMDGDDEDGVVFTELTPGNTTVITVTTRGFGFLHAWIDYNHDGDWDDPAEYIIRGDPKSDETTDYTINVPLNALNGYTYARFRYRRRPESQLNAPDMDTFGEHLPGEVEDYRIHIGQMLIDYGDAPDEPFPTFHQNNGARHIIEPDVYLGLGVSGENDGKPDSLALGDDDDGVELLGATIIGDTTLLNITASTTGFLKAWIDYNGDGDWEDETEEVCDTQINEGSNELAIYIPDDAAEGPTYGRFRFSEDTIPSFDGEIYSGEVEDMRFFMTRGFPYDYGDAPENDTLHYETLLASDGARHPISTSIGLGTVGSSRSATPDGELDGRPSIYANGDDTDGFDDEDGILFQSYFAPGETTTIDVWMNGAGYLHGWADFNRDGDFLDTGEYFLQFNNTVLPEVSRRFFDIATPETAVPGYTYFRFRYSSDPAPFTPGGLGGFGEVEDHMMEILPYYYDYGDAPDTYNTTGGTAARHPINFLVMLGETCDTDPVGQPGPDADGDDTDTDGDDDDGVEFTEMVPGETTTITIQTRHSGFLYGWIDFNADGDWDDPGENIISDDAKSEETTDYAIDVPADAVLGYTYARFRYILRYGDESTPPVVVNSYGASLPGEVEDYKIYIGEMYDFGDAPDDDTYHYETLLAHNGARHPVDGTTYLASSSAPSVEPDGQPDLNANDDGGYAEENGVIFHTVFSPEETTTIQAYMAGAAHLHGWIDFNRDGDFHDSGEYFLQFDNTALPYEETRLFDIVTPETAVPGPTYIRFRYCTDPAPFTPGGLGGFGEVEDFKFYILEHLYDYGDAPITYNTTGDDAARHPVNKVVALGIEVDSEPAGLPTVNADGDDMDGSYNDEEGVTFSSLNPGETTIITIQTIGPGYLYAWIDFNRDGDWDDAGENIITGDSRTWETTDYTIDVPVDAVPGDTYARFRYVLASMDTPPVVNSYGTSLPGEVEDYMITIGSSKSNVGNQSGVIPNKYALKQNFPNPFNPETHIEYDLPVRSGIKLTIFDVLGHEIKTWEIADQQAGSYKIVWHGHDSHNKQMATGIYIYEIKAAPIDSDQAPFHSVRKMIFLK